MSGRILRVIVAALISTIFAVACIVVAGCSQETRPLPVGEYKFADNASIAVKENGSIKYKDSCGKWSGELVQKSCDEDKVVYAVDEPKESFDDNYDDFGYVWSIDSVSLVIPTDAYDGSLTGEWRMCYEYMYVQTDIMEVFHGFRTLWANVNEDGTAEQGICYSDMSCLTSNWDPYSWNEEGESAAYESEWEEGSKAGVYEFAWKDESRHPQQTKVTLSLE